MKVVFVDNFDSFTYNLVEYVSETRAPDGSLPETAVLQNTASTAEIRAESPDAIVVSPGPGHPATDRDVGVSNAVFQDLAREIPTLGVCLGMEAAIHVYGGTIGPAPEPVHGKAYPIEHDGTGVFQGLDQGFQAGRYHSLSAIEIPSAFEVSAWTAHDGERLPMAVRHQQFPIVGVQFHPESVLTAAGHDVIEAFLEMAATTRRSAESIHPD
jgi:anthranilate synthase component 2